MRGVFRVGSASGRDCGSRFGCRFVGDNRGLLEISGAPDMVWITLGVVVVLVGALIVFNRLVQFRNRAAGSWADIDGQLKRRHDLVGSLVEAVKGYAQHERQVLEKGAAARSSAEGARTQGRRGAAGTAESR